MPRVFHDGELTGRAEFERTLLALGLQRRLGPAALLRAGLGVGRVTIEPRAAFAPAPPTNGSDGVRAVEFAAVWDTLDDRWLPTRGARLAIAVDRSLPGLGATHRYWRMLGRGQGALPLPVGVLQAEAFAGVSGGDVPAYDLFRLGGPSLMPGLHRDERWGRQALAIAIGHGVGLGPLRLTARLGGGRTFSERGEIALGALSFGWGVSVERSTRFGPVMIGWGHSADTGSRFYFSAGPPLRF
jgi:outer membrane protein assembly factor BamA